MGIGYWNPLSAAVRITSKLTRPSSSRKWLNCQPGLKMDVRVQPSPREDGVGSSRE